MKSTEANILPQSDFFTYNASDTCKKMFFYPIYIGEFFYNDQYRLNRSNFNNYLIMFITSGSVKITTEGNSFIAHKDDVVILNCYKPHAYESITAFSALWVHFDSPTASLQYDAIVKNLGNVIRPRDPNTVEYTLRKIVNVFKSKSNIRDSSMNKYITYLMTELFLSGRKHIKKTKTSVVIEEIISFINDNYMHQITIEQLSELANFSQYYFIKIFSEETGLTPLQFIINTRINSAKFLLKTTQSSIKEIAFASGFTNESVFCTTFKKRENITPSQYRMIDITHN